MKIIITIIKYLTWLLLSVFSGMGCMRLELGKPPEATGLWVIFNGIAEFVIIWIGGFIGLVSFVPFVLIDQFYIKRKIETELNQNIIRILSVLILSATVTLIHYVLEFVLDWI